MSSPAKFYLAQGVALCAILAGPAFSATVTESAGSDAQPVAAGDGIRIPTPVVASALSVTGPEGIAWRGVIRGNTAHFGSQELGRNLPDGLYRWELRAIAEPRQRGVDSELVDSGSGLLGSGIFRVVGGAAIVPDPSAVEPGDKDQVIPDDLIVQGSICAGFDCVNNENFGADTIRLKENNLRIHFDDTSSTSSFPSNDWRLVANDQSNGGQSQFSLEDATAGRVPFLVEAGAPTNSLYVDDTGRVGLRTSTPVLDIHIKTGNTPAIRLEQDGSSGFTAQTWDIAGNEANFFVRDATGGSTLPFRIQPGASSNMLTIDAEDRVGVGTNSPSQRFEVVGGDVKVGRITGGNTSLFIENTGGTAASSWILRANGTTGGFTFTEAGGNTPFRINTGAINQGLTITSTGVDVVGTLRVNGTPMNVPDFVFDPSYRLLPIEEQRQRMFSEGHLPSVPKEQLGEDGRPTIDLVAYQMGMLEELEKAHLYIGQLHTHVGELQADQASSRAQLEEKARQLATLEQRLEALEAHLANVGDPE